MPAPPPAVEGFEPEVSWEVNDEYDWPQIEDVQQLVPTSIPTPPLQASDDVSRRPIARAAVITRAPEAESRLNLLTKFSARSRTAIAELVELTTDLEESAAIMKETFKVTLKEMSERCNAVLVKAGELKQSRDSLFEKAPKTPKHCRQAADELLAYRINMLDAVEANGRVIHATRKELEPLYEDVVACLRVNGKGLRAAMEALTRERDLVQLAKERGLITERTETELELVNRDALLFVKRNNDLLRDVSEAVRQSREEFKHAMEVNKSTVRTAIESVKRDQEVIFEWSLDRVSLTRKQDRSFVVSVIEANGEALERVPDEFKNDREIVLLAIQSSNGWALQFASESLRRDRDIVLVAVRRSGWALEHVAQELRGDSGIVAAAVEVSGEALEFASDELKRDRDLVLTAVRRSGGWAIRAAAEELRGDRELAMAALKQNGLMLEHVSEELRDTKELVLAAVQKNGLALEHASAAMRCDQEVVTVAVQSSPQALKFAMDDSKLDCFVLKDAISKDGRLLEFLSERWRSDFTMVSAAVRQCGHSALVFAETELRNDPALREAALRVDATSDRSARDFDVPGPRLMITQPVSIPKHGDATSGGKLPPPPSQPQPSDEVAKLHLEITRELEGELTQQRVVALDELNEIAFSERPDFTASEWDEVGPDTTVSL